MTEKHNTKATIATVCDICGLSRKGAQAGTITGWIFGGARCQCFASDVTSAAGAETNKAFTGLQLGKKNLSETYELLAVIGTGGMGTVYKAREKASNNLVALKLLRPELSNDPIAVRRFQYEISAAQELLHPNLVRIFNCGISHEGNPYFVMELVDGESLAAMLEREGALSPERVNKLFAQICSALSHAHSKNIIHRDLKPNNILVVRSPDGGEIVKLVDFGVAKILPTPGKDTFTITKTGEIFGSPTYMSPEQCQGEKVDVRSDIYALGCVMYESFTGGPPIHSENPVKTLLAHIYDQPPPMQLQNVSRDLAHKLQLIVKACLEKRPDERYASVQELADDLQLAFGGKEPKVVKAARAKEARAQFKRNVRMHMASVLPVMLIATAILAIWITGRNLYAMTSFVNAMDREPKDYLNPAYPQKYGVDPYDIPFCYQFAGEKAGKRGDFDKAVNILQAESSILLHRGDKDSAVAPNVDIEQFESWRGHTKLTRDAARRSAELLTLLANSREISKGMRFADWFYIILYPAKLEMYKLPQRMDEAGDAAGGQQICALLNKANTGSLITEFMITNTVHHAYVGHTAAANAFYETTIDRVGGLINQPLDPFVRFISDISGLPTDVPQMYFGDRRCPPELLNRYFADCSLACGDVKTARILFANIGSEYRSLGLATCEALLGGKNLEPLFDRVISDRLFVTDWTEDDLISRLFMAQKYQVIDLIYEHLIAAATRRGSQADTLTIKFEENYSSLLTAQNRKDEADKLRNEAVRLIDHLAYSPEQHGLLRSLGDQFTREGSLSAAASTYQLLLAKDMANSAMKQYIPYDKLDIACVAGLQGHYSTAENIYDDLIKTDQDKTITCCALIAKVNMATQQKNLLEAAAMIRKIAIFNPAPGSQGPVPWADCNLYMADRKAQLMWQINQPAEMQSTLNSAEKSYYQSSSRMTQTNHCDLAATISRSLSNTAMQRGYTGEARRLHAQLSPREIFDTIAKNREWMIYTADVVFGPDAKPLQEDATKNDLAARLAKQQFYRIPGKVMALSLPNLTESQKHGLLEIYPDAYEAQLVELRHQLDAKMVAKLLRQGAYAQEIEKLSAELTRLKGSKWMQAKNILSADQVSQLEQQIALQGE